MPSAQAACQRVFSTAFDEVVRVHEGKLARERNCLKNTKRSFAEAMSSAPMQVPETFLTRLVCCVFHGQKVRPGAFRAAFVYPWINDLKNW